MDAEELRFHHESGTKDRTPDPQADERSTEAEIVLLIPKTEAQQKLALFEQKHYTAKARLLRELIQESVLDYSLVTGKLNISAAVIRGMAQQQILKVESSRQFRNPVSHLDQKGYHLTLNENQQRVVDTVCSDLDAGIHKTYLLRGVTGSGKTEVIWN